MAFNPFEAVDEHNINLNLGVTLLSQNLLSNTEAFASYGCCLLYTSDAADEL